jgi:hypothetical protein
MTTVANAHSVLCDGGCFVDCDCGRGRYADCIHSSCYDCFLDRREGFVTCIFCGNWHSPAFDTCFSCSPLTRGRDDAGAALKMLILWRDGQVCTNCGVRQGDLQTDPRLIRPKCLPNCATEHNHKRACQADCNRNHKHRAEAEPGVCTIGCHQVHSHRIKDDDGVRHALIHIDHIIPCAKGGLADEWNLRALCGVCNVAKGAEWWPGCRHDKARTELCRRYFLLGTNYFTDEVWQRFYAEVKAYRVTRTWDPITNASYLTDLTGERQRVTLSGAAVVVEDVPPEWAHLDP